MIVHLVPDFVNNDEYGAGNWKAAEASRITIRALGSGAIEIPINSKSPLSCLDKIPPAVKDFYIEYSFFPELLVALRQRFGSAKIHVRTVNAEAFQYFHRNRRSYTDLLKPALWRDTVRITRRDMKNRRIADSLLGISEWDNRNYWRLMPGKARIDYVPYFCPWPTFRPQIAISPWSQRSHSMLSFGGNFDPSGEANFRNFDLLANGLKGRTKDEWKFVLTWWSQWNERVPEVSERVEILREVPQPWDLLCEVRALAVLTPFGFGFKTSIVDGLAAGCHVIVHSVLAKRLPGEVRELCIPCDPSKPDDVARVAAAIVVPPVDHHLNQRLSDQALEVATRRIDL